MFSCEFCEISKNTSERLLLENFPQTFKWKSLYLCCIRCYTCIQIYNPLDFLHKLHLHEMSYHVFIYRLKAERLSAFLIHGGSLFHIFGPRTLKLFSPNFTWSALTTFKFRFCRLRAGLSNNLISKMFDIERGFNWCRVLKLSRQSAFNLCIVIVDLFEFSKRSM